MGERALGTNFFQYKVVIFCTPWGLSVLLAGLTVFSLSSGCRLCSIKDGMPQGHWDASWEAHYGLKPRVQFVLGKLGRGVWLGGGFFLCFV